MKKLVYLFSLLVAVTAISGCAGIKKQNNINKYMENFVFNAPADKVYNAAVAKMGSMYVTIKPVSKHHGASDWNTNNTSLGGNSYQEQVRFSIAVNSNGNDKSTLRIYRERKTNLSGSWSEAHKQRFLIYEYNVLQQVNPSRAASLEKMAAAK